MRHFFGIAGVAADNVTNSSAARPAQHPIIFRQYSAGDAFSQCLSTHAVDAFFQQCSATELTGSEEDLLNSLCHVAEMVQAVLPRSVSLQEWAHRRVPRGFERQVNSSGLVYVGGRYLQYAPLLHNEPRSAGSAAQPACDSSTAARLVVFDSTPAEPASAVEEDLSASSHSNATGESAVSQEAAYSYTMCLECGWAITTRPRDVWWTTLLLSLIHI